MTLKNLFSAARVGNGWISRGAIFAAFATAALTFSLAPPLAAKGPAKPHATPHPHSHQVAHPHDKPARPQQGSHPHHGGTHRGGYHRKLISVNYYGYSQGYRRGGYYRHRGYGANSQMAFMSRMYQQQYQLMAKQRQAELQAFLAAFDTNHNGYIDGKERGPAEHYLRERRLGKIPPLAIASNSRPKK